MTDISPLENVQTSTGGHSASHSMSTTGSFWGQSGRVVRMTNYQRETIHYTPMYLHAVLIEISTPLLHLDLNLRKVQFNVHATST